MSHIETTSAASFLFAGKAAFTLQSKVTGCHYSYRIAESKDGSVFFASVVQNGAKMYVGIIPSAERWKFRSTRASKLPSSHPAVAALEWFLKHLDSDKVELHHCGKCGRCGRKLTHPESIKSGIGPECARIIGSEGAARGLSLDTYEPSAHTVS
jgi:hypothetical protein